MHTDTPLQKILLQRQNEFVKNLHLLLLKITTKKETYRLKRFMNDTGYHIVKIINIAMPSDKPSYINWHVSINECGEYQGDVIAMPNQLINFVQKYIYSVHLLCTRTSISKLKAPAQSGKDIAYSIQAGLISKLNQLSRHYGMAILLVTTRTNYTDNNGKTYHDALRIHDRNNGWSAICTLDGRVILKNALNIQAIVPQVLRQYQIKLIYALTIHHQHHLPAKLALFKSDDTLPAAIKCHQPKNAKHQSHSNDTKYLKRLKKDIDELAKSYGQYKEKQFKAYLVKKLLHHNISDDD